MPDKTWKKSERRVAALFGSTRTPLSGGNGKQTRSDTLSERVFVENKYRKRHAPVSLFHEVEALAEAEGKFPVVVLSERGRRRAFAVVPLSREYLIRLLGELA